MFVLKLSSRSSSKCTETLLLLSFIAPIQIPTLILTVIEHHGSELLSEMTWPQCSEEMGSRIGTQDCSQDGQKLRWCNFRDVYNSHWELKIHKCKHLLRAVCCSRGGGGIRHDPLRRQFDFGGRDWTTDGFVYHLHTPHKTNQPERSSQKILVIEATPLNAIHSWPPVAALTFDKTKLSASCTEPGCTYIAHWKRLSWLDSPIWF